VYTPSFFLCSFIHHLKTDTASQEETYSRNPVRIIQCFSNSKHKNFVFFVYLIFFQVFLFSNHLNFIDQRNRDVIGDTALLSAFISLQTCATDLEQLKYNLDHRRQHFETLQEKLTALRDARYE